MRTDAKKKTTCQRGFAIRTSAMIKRGPGCSRLAPLPLWQYLFVRPSGGTDQDSNPSKYSASRTQHRPARSEWVVGQRQNNRFCADCKQKKSHMDPGLQGVLQVTLPHLLLRVGLKQASDGPLLLQDEVIGLTGALERTEQQNSHGLPFQCCQKSAHTASSLAPLLCLDARKKPQERIISQSPAPSSK